MVLGRKNCAVLQLDRPWGGSTTAVERPSDQVGPYGDGSFNLEHLPVHPSARQTGRSPDATRSSFG